MLEVPGDYGIAKRAMTNLPVHMLDEEAVSQGYESWANLPPLLRRYVDNGVSDEGQVYAAPMRSTAPNVAGKPPRSAGHRARPKPTVHFAERLGYRPGDPETKSMCGRRCCVITAFIEQITCPNCRRKHARPGAVRVLRQVRGQFGQVRLISG